MAIGIICEYNPFHNGHIYHIKQIKKQFPNDIIVLVVSGPFTERADISVLTKWEKADIALTYGVDLVIELPFIFASGSADLFAHGAITILKELKVEYLVFGSEENCIQKLTTLASIQLQPTFQEQVKELMSTGINYPTALSNTLKRMTNLSVQTPNDLLGISYIKEILIQKASINPISIQRTNHYHDTTYNGTIASASSIRNAIKEKKDIKKLVPQQTLLYLHENIDTELFFTFLKYKIISEKNNLITYHEVTEKLIPRILKAISKAHNLDEFIHMIQSKSETYSKLKRICLYILCGLTKEEANFYKKNPYIHILGFTEGGKHYLNQIKKNISIPMISNYSNDKNKLLSLDYKILQIYVLFFPIELQKQILDMEIKNRPIYKKSE